MAARLGAALVGMSFGNQEGRALGDASEEGRLVNRRWEAEGGPFSETRMGAHLN